MKLGKNIKVLNFGRPCIYMENGEKELICP